MQFHKITAGLRLRLALRVLLALAAGLPPVGHVSAVRGDGFDLAQRKQIHWAWRPIAMPSVPNKEEAPGAKTAIDAFLVSRLQAAGLSRAAAADKRTLLRRASFDLIGLPPTPEDVAAFEADSSPDAFAKVVDRLLASPQFGERWARHWLDVVRYAETLGHEFDYPLVNAWQYRDYVIRALNSDLPYDQFVREHIAGDLLDAPRVHPARGFNESIIATAFWYLGEATHAPVDHRADQATRVENQVDVFSKAFLGLTVACARCHDHKFDAISTRDYYALAGYAASSHQQAALLDEDGKIEAHFQRLVEIEERARRAARKLVKPEEADQASAFAKALLAAREAAAGEAPDAADSAVEGAFGGRLVPRDRLDHFAAAVAAAKTDPASPLHVWSVLADSRANDDSFAARRYQLASELEARQKQVAEASQGQVVFADFDAGFESWFRTGWAFGETATAVGEWVAGGFGPVLLPSGQAHSGRYGSRLRGVIRSAKFTIEKPFIHYRLAGHGEGGKVRLIIDGYTMDNFSPLLVEGLSFDVATDSPMQWHVQSVARHMGHRAHIELIDDGECIVAVDEICFADRETTAPPTDAIGPLVLAKCEAATVESLAEAYGSVWAQACEKWQKGESSAEAEFVRWAIENGLACADEAAKAELYAAGAERNAVDEALPEPAKVVGIADGSGEDWAVQVGGSYKRPGPVAPRQLLEAIAGASQPTPTRGSGRLELADRLLSQDNPFPARVMANRIWAHLFGRGLVATVDNFGALGEQPTHPELLDYLATRFRDDNWSVKRLIREIMLTDAYQASSVGDPAAEEADPQNRLLHRANVRRLEGEAVRDSLLAISGELDRSQFGPSVPIHLTEFMEGRGRPKESGPLDGGGRRSIYIEVRRNFLSPMMLAYDTPPPASCVGQRNRSNVPAQSLIMMNDPFVMEQCRHWAERLLARGEGTAADRIDNLYLTAFSRQATSEEVEAATAFLAEQAAALGVGPDDLSVWTDLCHVLVNLKEFVFLN